MSLRARDLPDGRLSPINQGLSRSCSFGGLLVNHPGSRRSTISGWSGQGILGQGVPPPSPRELRRLNSLPPYVKVPKTPRPERASVVSCAVSRGLKDAIATTRHDLLSLRKSQNDYRIARSQGRVYEMEKQIKAAERFLKRLEFLLSQIEDLHDQYSLNHRLRDGVRTMAYAYAISPGKEKASALSNVRCGYRECTETLCSLEVQIEQLIGTLSLEMKGIQGFARLCPGDVFDVVIKHGSQKWKSRGRIGKDNSQVWDNPTHVFKGLIGEMLVIKAMEVRLLGKSVTIGNKICETKDFFAPHPQLMTVNLNPSGSLKLNLIITWNPLDVGSEDTLSRTSSLTGASPKGRKKSFIPSLNSSPPPHPQYSNFLTPSSKDLLISPECGDDDSSFGSISARSSTTTDSASSPISECRRDVVPGSHDSIVFDGRGSASPQCDTSGNFTLVRKEENRVAQWARYSHYNVSQSSHLNIMSRSFPNLSSQFNSPLPQHNGGPPFSTASATPPSNFSHSLSQKLNLLGISSHPDTTKGNNESSSSSSSLPDSLPKVISRLRSCLEDIQGQFPLLHLLEESVVDLHELCGEPSRSRRDSNTSEISLSVESALECFDFLYAECDDDFGDDNPEECLAKNQKESLVRGQVVDKPDTMPPLVTGVPQLDTFLLVHLKHSLQLMPDLGKCGPLKGKEKESISKLEKEGRLLSSVMKHRGDFSELKPQFLIQTPHTQVLCDSVFTSDNNWCVAGKCVVDGLLAVVSSLVEPPSQEFSITVLEELVRRMTDSVAYSDCLTVTVGHFIEHLQRPLQEIVPEVTSSLICARCFTQADAKSVEEGLSKIHELTPLHTKLLCRLCYSSPGGVLPTLLSYLDSHKENEKKLLHSIYDGCLLLLESATPEARCSACALIGHLLGSRLLLQSSLTRKSSSSSSPEGCETPPLPDTAVIKDSKKSPEKAEGAKPIPILSYVFVNDPSENVRESAKLALLKLGPIGAEALESVQLLTNVVR